MKITPKILSNLYHKASGVIEILPEKYQVKLVSVGRVRFMKHFVEHNPTHIYVPDESLALTAWGLKFRSSLMNAAGMFKNGEGYDVVAALGAGGYIAGTSTANYRAGNAKSGIDLPFITLPESKAAINWLGLPNYGDDVLSKTVITANKLSDCPIGWSVMRSPDYDEAEGLQRLINSLWKYHDNLQIDFIEINESCPNIKHGGGSIVARLQIIATEFLKKRKRQLPVVVKLSNDLTPNLVVELVGALIKLGFDGVNLGNTSTSYQERIKKIAYTDRELYSYFTKEFGGGISGYPLKSSSLELCGIAAEVVEQLQPNQEFNIIRTGGIDCYQDIIDSEHHGVKLNQWYTGMFTNYNHDGDNLYRNLFCGK